MTTLSEAVAIQVEHARAAVSQLSLEVAERQRGSVLTVGSDVATISGLAATRLDEVLLLPGDARAVAVSLDLDQIGAMLLDRNADIKSGAEVRGTGEVVRAPVGEALLGRVVDPLGVPRDGGPAVNALRFDPIERAAPGIIDRELVTEPLNTGVLVVDAMIPIGRGQRELIIGDRATGKTAIALDAILNQRRSDVICIYVAIGQKASAVGRLIEEVKKNGAFERCIFVVAEADDAAGLQWIAPYAACTMAEYFRDTGRHALLVLDDLSKHAVIHRQLSLLLRSPPGREAYPGDVFYLHSRLLERAAKLNQKHGGGSLTALPIAETQGGNLSAYIPTNLISITDGQIYLEPKLFYEGQKPAVSVGKSVSRVGGKTQTATLKRLAGSLRLDYAQFLELEVFARFGQIVDPRTARALEHGARIRAVLAQPQGNPYPPSVGIALLLCVQEGLLDEISLAQVQRFKASLAEELLRARPIVLERTDQSGDLGESERTVLLAWLRERLRAFSSQPTKES
jgi:F-type H+-transporting ATPase subunit alpha